ncbi:MAG TPA: aminoglycoside adenylyltransferase domain-containing protein, partial [Thermoleophilaceae bacterium]|nr:aminoglycoside adenylyltransferase domain-containing protein [Thermoleophilaceae bacterium]
TWTLGNLNGYWRGWAQEARRGGPRLGMALPRRFAAWGALGAPRLHYTLSTGAIATKEDAGRYALEVFEPRWHPLIEDALAYWRGLPPSPAYRRLATRRRRDAAEFVASVIDTANGLVAAGAVELPNFTSARPSGW